MDTGKFYDKDFRQQLINNPKKVFADFNQHIADDIEIVVMTNTKSIYHVIMPDSSLPLDDLQSINAAKASTLGTAATVGTVGSVFSTLGSVGTIGSVGSGGTAADVNISKQ